MSDSKNTIAAIVGNTPVQVAEVAGLNDFKTEQNDVIIVTFPKTGTTWLQQICHQIRTGGHIDFEEISDERIVPWLEVGPFIGIDLSLPQTAPPRCFKSHAALSELSFLEAAGARYICMLRDPEATMVSMFKFHHAKHMGSEETDVNKWALEHFFPNADRKNKSIWEFYIEIWKCRDLANVLIIVYENLKTQLSSYIPRVATFMGLPAPASDTQVKIEELCSFEWMSMHQHLFDDHHMGIRHDAFKEQFPELEQEKAAGKAKVKGKGKGEGKGKAKGKDDKIKPAPKVGLQLGDGFNTTVHVKTRELLVQTWREHVTPVTGHQTYEDMAAELQAMC